MKYIYLVNGVSFNNSIDAGKFVIFVASKKRKVSLERKITYLDNGDK